MSNFSLCLDGVFPEVLGPVGLLSCTLSILVKRPSPSLCFISELSRCQVSRSAKIVSSCCRPPSTHNTNTRSPCQGFLSGLNMFPSCTCGVVDVIYRAKCHLALFDLWLCGMAPAVKFPSWLPWFGQVKAGERRKNQSGYIFLLAMKSSWAKEENMFYNSPAKTTSVWKLMDFVISVCESNWSHSYNV